MIRHALFHTRRGRFGLVAWLVYIAGCAVAIALDISTALWSLTYIALVLGTVIGAQLAYRDGIEDGHTWTLEAIEAAQRRAMVVAGLTIGETLQSIEDDDERRGQAPNN